MTWVVWRQHHNQVYFAVGALGAFAILLLVTGQQMAAQYDSALAACARRGGCGDRPMVEGVARDVSGAGLRGR